MNREQRKDLLEGVGIVAIIASLIFVGIETRNSTAQTELNTRAVEIAAYQQLMANITAANAQSVTSEDAAGVIAAMREWSDSDVYSWRIASAFYQQFRHGDIAYFMYQRGVIDEDRLLSALRPLPLRKQKGREFWANSKVSFVPAYQVYIDSLIEQGFYD